MAWNSSADPPNHRLFRGLLMDREDPQSNACLLVHRDLRLVKKVSLKGDVVTILPNGKELTLTMRDVDIENVEKIKRMKNITVIEDIKEIEVIIENSKEKLDEK